MMSESKFRDDTKRPGCCPAAPLFCHLSSRLAGKHGLARLSAYSAPTKGRMPKTNEEYQTAAKALAKWELLHAPLFALHNILSHLVWLLRRCSLAVRASAQFRRLSDTWSRGSRSETEMTASMSKTPDKALRRLLDEERLRSGVLGSYTVLLPVWLASKHCNPSYDVEDKAQPRTHADVGIDAEGGIEEDVFDFHNLSNFEAPTSCGQNDLAEPTLGRGLDSETNNAPTSKPI